MDENEFPMPEPTNTWTCDCGVFMKRCRGQGDQTCPSCGQEFNAGGQRLRSDWRGNPSTWDENIGDMEGYEDLHFSYDDE